MSSKRRIRRRSCGRKRAYPTKLAAQIDARQATRRDARKINAYRCRFCHQWHIGHAPAWVNRKVGW